MKTIITSARVAQLAFRAPDLLPEDSIPPSTIVAAEERFLRPVLGAALCDALAEGAYPKLLDDYIAPALALYVKALMLPTLAVQSGAAGTVEIKSGSLASAPEAKLRAAVRRLRGDALALVRRAVEHIESSRAATGGDPGAFPEYDPSGNVLHRCSLDGGIALTRRANPHPNPHPQPRKK
jgi:hypothetical protein